MNGKIESFFRSVRGKKVVFCGVGTSNLPLVQLFLEKGAEVTACDRREREQLGKAADDMEQNGAVLKLGARYLDDLDADIIFRTPGMKYALPQLEEARKRGVAVTSEMEMFFDLCPCKIFAVTGSDGKTTTTSIIAEMLKAQGKTVHLGGNIGRPLLPEIESIQEDDVAVVELSSFQLISMRRSPEVAVVTNLSPNHLDIHKDMAEYIDAKKNIFLHQNAFGRTVLNADNEITSSFRDDVRGQAFMFSRKAQVDFGAWVRGDGMIMMAPENTEVLPIQDIRIPGLHNVENYLAAICAVWGDVSVANIHQVAKEFGGVPHRAEFVRTVEGVRYYNDSIASSPTRTASGTLSLYPEKIILICGGYDKKIPYDALGPVIVEKVKGLILMGATAPKIESAVKASEQYREGNPAIYHVADMEEAVAVAHRIARSGDIVSLSPASASFDLYPNFEVRGNHFKQLVNEL